MSWFKKLKDAWGKLGSSEHPTDPILALEYPAAQPQPEMPVASSEDWDRIEAWSVPSLWKEILSADKKGIFPGYTIVCYNTRVKGFHPLTVELKGPLSNLPTLVLRTPSSQIMSDILNEINKNGYIEQGGYVVTFLGTNLVSFIIQDNQPMSDSA